jgi:hypothetical protein
MFPVYRACCPRAGVAATSFGLETPGICVQSALASSLRESQAREGTAMTKVMSALVTAIFVAAALLEWVAMRM